MVATAPAANTPVQHIVLEHVSWETYESLLADYVDQSVPHFTYDQGKLEIVSPNTPREEDNRTLQRLAEMLAEEWNVEFRNVGSMTFKREDLARGFEPDTSFYIQHVEDVRGREQISLTEDPPPDLLIEIEVTSAAIAKLPIYAAVGIPEVWRIRRGDVRFLSLEDATYKEVRQSVAFPRLDHEVATRFLSESHTKRQLEWMRTVRAWAREQTPG